MSKHHQASRRRTYGRRQHEIHERTERSAGLLAWLDDSEVAGSGERWNEASSGRILPDNWLHARGTI